jgi:type IV pilus assembly protein PilZ
MSGSVGFAEDLSMSGMFIATLDPLPFGCSLVVRFALPGQDAELVVPAIVRWIRRHEGMGVQFGLLGVRETHAIAEFLDKHSEEGSGDANAG